MGNITTAVRTSTWTLTPPPAIPTTTSLSMNTTSSSPRTATPQKNPSRTSRLPQRSLKSPARLELSTNINPDPRLFFAQPGILAAVIGGAVVGLLCAILLVMFIVYRMRKKDEGSYALDEPKRSPNVNSYSKPPSREFYA